MNPFKDQYIADGTQIKFPFTFEIPTTRKINVYVQQGALADETTDLVSPGDYTLTFNNTGGEPSDGNVQFNTAPVATKIVTITPDNETSVSYQFSNTEKFNATNLNNSFSETASTNNFQLSNYLDASLRYNLNEQDTLLTYSNRVPALPDKAFWRRDGQAIAPQDYNLFVEEVATDIKENVVDQVNAGANNTNLSADIANKAFGDDYSGNVKTIQPDGTIVNTPLTPGKSALSAALSAKLWATDNDPFIDAYGNQGSSAKHYSLIAQTAASSAGGVITELYVKSATPVTKVDLIDYSVSPKAAWINVLENSFTVYVDGVKQPEPLSYSDGTVVPDKPYTVTVVQNPTVDNPSYITFAPAIAANKEILIARSEAQGNSATMFVDSSNAVFLPTSKVAARDLSNSPKLADINNNTSGVAQNAAGISANDASIAALQPLLVSVNANGTQVIPVGGPQIVDYKTIIINDNTWFNTTTSEFKPTIAGFYEYSFYTEVTNINTNPSLFTFRVLKNTTAITNTGVNIGVPDDEVAPPFYSSIVQMNGTTDTLRFEVVANTQAITISANSNFSAKLLKRT